MTQVGMPAPGTDSPLPSSPHSRTAFGRMLDRGNTLATAAANAGFTAAEPLPRSPRPAAGQSGRRGEEYAFTAAVPGRRGDVTIEPVTELGSGGALRLPRARVVPLSVPPSSYTAAVERYLTGAGIAKSSADLPDLAHDTGGCSPANRRRPDPPAGARSPPSSPSPRSTTRHCRRCWPNWRRRGRTRWTPTPSTETVHHTQGDRLAAAPGLDRRRPDDRHRAAAGTARPHQGPRGEPDRRPVAPRRGADARRVPGDRPCPALLPPR
jgi:hypothetical protein